MIYEQYGNDTVIFSNMAAPAENAVGSLQIRQVREKISKAWNGSGPMNELYWLRIKEYL